ncbi:uncharacterized protein LOC111903651 [Lactuca sativa]|uniref:uncharacterized protein LOC111903651 n=1 Tax=Lactuca sativa TaxID=4236 RepID=UPI000CD85805|nr:uncharacterized protein LOC111903651 [Lactuca sativa]
MVAQSFDWDDQIQALNLSGPENAHLAQVRDDVPVGIVAAEDSVIELQFALMVSSSHEPNLSKSISEDEDEEVVYKPVSKSSASSKGKSKASLEGESSGSHKGGSSAASEGDPSTASEGEPSAAPEGESSTTSSGESSATPQGGPFLEHESPQSVYTDSSDAETTPHISTEKEFIPNDASAMSISQNLLVLLN